MSRFRIFKVHGSLCVCVCVFGRGGGAELTVEHRAF